MKSKEDTALLWFEEGNPETKDMEQAEVLNAFSLPLGFHSKVHHWASLFPDPTGLVCGSMPGDKRRAVPPARASQG